MIQITYIVYFLFIFMIFYVLMKEREDAGCNGISIAHHCYDEESVYIRNTRGNSNDNCNDLTKKLISILSYHDKGGLWRRCFIIAIIIAFFIYICYNVKNKYNFIVVVLVICSFLYFYHNYVYFHHFRILKTNGIEILDLMKNKC
jgi:hypothetical protein